MCGIIAYIGHREALPLLIGGLKRLEYRGYDSAGVGLLRDGKIVVVKKQVCCARIRKLEWTPSYSGACVYCL